MVNVCLLIYKLNNLHLASLSFLKANLIPPLKCALKGVAVDVFARFAFVVQYLDVLHFYV